nr:hypothetical protein [Tanacetum cinerariifolium]
DVLEKIVLKPLFEEEIIPMKIDQHPDNAKSNLMESLHIRLIEKLLYDNSSPRPPEEFVSANSDAEIESFSPSPILVKDSDSLMEEIDLFCTSDYPMPPGIEDDDYDSEKDILILKDLPSNNPFSFAEKESFHFDIPSFSRPPAKPPDGDTRILNIKMMGDISDQKAFMHKLMITLAPHQEKSPDLLSHQCFKAFQPFAKCPMMIYGQNNPILDIPACYDDDDDDYTIAITHKEPDNGLSMGDDHLDTVPATESNEFIKPSVENLVLNPSKSEGEYECDVPACEAFTTFLNILFDADYDFYSVDDQSFSDEDIPKKIYSNPLFDEEIISMKIDPHHFNAESDLIESLLNHDSPIISSSSKIDSLFHEFVGKLTLLKSIPPGINETDCDPENETRFIKRLLYDNSSPRPLKEFISENSNAVFESFSPFPIHSDSLMEEIDLSFTPDDQMPPDIEEDDYDSERDILILEELLSNNSLLFPKNESFYFDIPSSSRPPAKPPDGNTNCSKSGEIS